MGTGKSAVGRELAEELRLEFVDIDDLIVRKEKRSINDIFIQNGEAYFRGLEKDALTQVSAGENQVVACGGGIVIDAGNIAVMRETGNIFALSASPEIILERTKKYTHRPLLNVDDPYNKVKDLLKARQPYYSKADLVIDTSSLSIKQVVSRIACLIKEKP